MKPSTSFWITVFASLTAMSLRAADIKHDLLILDKHPDPKMNHEAGHFPVSWSKSFGQGKVFYTSLGHREDIWDTDATIKDRKNEAEISKAYQQHVLGGILWALGLKK